MASYAVDSIVKGQSIKSAKKVVTKFEAYTPPSRRSCAKGSNPKHRLFAYPVGSTAKTSL